MRRLVPTLALLFAGTAALAQTTETPSRAFGGLNANPSDTAQPGRPLPIPALAPLGDSSAGQDADAAYGAYQRGLYLTALRIAEPLANMGDTAAQTLLGEINLLGRGVRQDSVEAARWYRVAAEAGVPQAQFRYAMMLIDGEGTEADPDAARDLMKRAADAGEPFAAFNYAQMLIEASPTGGFPEARPYFETAAESGVADGQYALSQLYANGLGVPEVDEVEARRWLAAAAVKGHDTAQIELGIWLVNGRGGPPDPLSGFRWLKGAAEGGNPIAINRVAHLYRQGVGTARDTDEAAKWAVLARRAGNADPELDGFLRTLPEDQQRRALEAANRFRAS